MIGEARARQQRYYDEGTDPEFEISRPHGCGRVYEYLIGRKLDVGLEVLGVALRGRSVLEVCCGSGMVTEALVREGAIVTGMDLSRAALLRARERARRFAFAARFIAGDAERLPCADGSFDVVTVHDGLHHLEDPARALREMARVARLGVLILEPARAALTGLAVRVGLAVEVEEAGNVVRRLVPGEVAACLRDEGFGHVRWRRTLMYYPHRPTGWLRWFDRQPRFILFRALFGGANWALGRWGNKLALGAMREPMPAVGTR